MKVRKLRLYIAPQLGHSVVRFEHVDTYGLVQGLVDCAEFKEVAGGIHFHYRIRCTKGTETLYVIEQVDKINAPTSNSVFAADFPPVDAVKDRR